VGLLWFLANCKTVDRCINPVMVWALQRWTDLDTRDYMNLLKLSDEYTVMEIQVQEEEWLADKKLKRDFSSGGRRLVTGNYS
jgi:hypothetical protein